MHETQCIKICDVAKAIPLGKSMAVNASMRKERFKMNDEKEKQLKLNPSRINKIIKMGIKMIKMRNKKQER